MGEEKKGQVVFFLASSSPQGRMGDMSVQGLP